MNQPTRLLYDYVLDTSFPLGLRTPRYRCAQRRADNLLEALCQTLSGEQQALLEQYTDAAQALQLLELEAMFQAAFSLPGELG